MRTKTRVLIVDDETLILAFLKAALTHHGYEVTAAASGPEALQLCMTQDFDCLLSDVLMPKMDGPELVLQLEQLGKKIPTLFMTGFVEKYDQVNSLQKPFQISEVIAGIQSAVGKKRSSGAA